MKDHIIRNFELYFPTVAERAIEVRRDKYRTLFVRTNDGDVYIYDDVERYIRMLPARDDMTENNFKREFSIRLRHVMFVKGITQTELSERTGISQAAISQYLTGKSMPGFYKLDRIARALDCNIDDLRYTE